MTRIFETDIAIIGAGPTGLFAAFQAGMMNMKSAIIDILPFPGGQCAALYPEKPIYDIPAYPEITSQTLVDQLVAQAEPFAPEYFLDQQVDQLEKQPDGRFLLTTSKNEMLLVKGVIIAAGCGAFGPNRPPLEGIESYEQHSVFYHVGARSQFEGKNLVIAGGGDSAIDWALSLAEVAAKIYVVHRRNKFRCTPESYKRLIALANHPDNKLELVVPYQLHGLKGENNILSHVVVSTLEGETRDLKADCLLPFFGLSMQLGPIAEWGLALDKKHIEVNPASMATSTEGVYAIGDMASYPGKLKLILTGFAEAALACHSLYATVHPDVAYHFEYSTSKGVPDTASSGTDTETNAPTIKERENA